MSKPTTAAAFLLALAVAWGLAAGGCAPEEPGRVELSIPPGYQPTLQVMAGDTLNRFGPFVGYYFKPSPSLEQAEFVCLNEEGFYASDIPVNAKLFEGEAVLARLPIGREELPESRKRITPVFFDQAPRAWLETRPEPAGEFRHFHSLHNARGASPWGYWLRHRAVASFTYDMGGRVGPESPLYHKVGPGLDSSFAQIVEFDRGPGRR
jgi:hypothetical protein